MDTPARSAIADGHEAILSELLRQSLARQVAADFTIAAWRSTEPRTDHYPGRLSQAGEQCLRRVMLESKRPRTPLDYTLTQAGTAIGSIYELAVSQWSELHGDGSLKMQVSTQVPVSLSLRPNQVPGTIDILIELPNKTATECVVVDVKTTASYAVKMMEQEGPSAEYAGQLRAYMAAAQELGSYSVTSGWLCVVDRNAPSRFKLLYVDDTASDGYSDRIDAMRTQLQYLVDAAQAHAVDGTLPPPGFKPDETRSLPWQCRYCVGPVAGGCYPNAVETKQGWAVPYE